MQYGKLCDFSIINNDLRGQKHRYVYALAAKRPTNFGNALAKHDTFTGQAQLFHEAGGTTGESCEVCGFRSCWPSIRERYCVKIKELFAT